MNEHGVHRSLRASQAFGPCNLAGTRGAQFFDPWKIFPGEISSLSGHLIQDTADIADHAYGDSSIAANLQSGRVDLNDLGIGRNIGRAAEANGEVLLAAQKYDHVGVANFGGGSIQAALEKAEG